LARSQGAFPRGRVRTPRRKTSWDAGPGGTGATTIISSSSAFVGAAVQGLVPGLTVTRIRGLLRIVMQSANAAGDGFQGAFGIGIASTAAVVAGIGSVPTPITEADADSWLYWMPISVHVGDKTAGDVNWQGAVQDVVVDTKAMRKMNDSFVSIYAAFEVTEIGTADMDLFFDSRALFLLS